MTFDVDGSGAQSGRVVLEQTQAVVAPLAQQLPNRAGLMVVVQVLGAGSAADGTPILLR
jgi:hypothetical protein